MRVPPACITVLVLWGLVGCPATSSDPAAAALLGDANGCGSHHTPAAARRFHVGQPQPALLCAGERYWRADGPFPAGARYTLRVRFPPESPVPALDFSLLVQPPDDPPSELARCPTSNPADVACRTELSAPAGAILLRARSAAEPGADPVAFEFVLSPVMHPTH